MSRLPNVGGDNNTWGNILNDFLGIEHNADGTQKTLDVTKGGTGAVDAATARTNLGAASSGHQATHQTAGSDALTGSVDANARLAVAKAGTTTGTRRKLNLIEGSNVTITTADNSGAERVDVTIATGLTGNYPGLNLKNYGAVGDGTTDDTTAINNWLTAVGGANQSVGYAPAGSYRFISQIVWPSGVRFVRGDAPNTGGGTEFLYDGGNLGSNIAAWKIGVSGSALSNFRLENVRLTLKTPGSITTGGGMQIINATNDGWVRGFTCFDFPDYCVELNNGGSGPGANFFTFEDFFVGGNSVNPFIIGAGVQQLLIRFGGIDLTTGTSLRGFYFPEDAADGMVVQIEGVKVEGVADVPFAESPNVAGSVNVMFTNCTRSCNAAGKTNAMFLEGTSGARRWQYMNCNVSGLANIYSAPNAVVPLTIPGPGANFYHTGLSNFLAGTRGAHTIAPSHNSNPNLPLHDTLVLNWMTSAHTAGTFDTNLYRSAANVLKTDDQFVAVDGVTTKYLSGAGKVTAVDGDFTVTPGNGTIAIVQNTTDSTTRIAVRANGAWKVVSVA